MRQFTLFMLLLVFAPAAFAQNATLTVQKRTAPIAVAGEFPDAIVATVKRGTTPEAGVRVQAVVDKKSGAKLRETEVKTNASGVASFTLITAQDLDITVDVSLADFAEQKATVKFAPPKLKYTIKHTKTPLMVRSSAADALLVTVTDESGEVPQKDVPIRAEVIGRKARLFSDGVAVGPGITVRTDAAGIARFSILTDDVTNFDVRITPLTDGGVPVDDELRIVHFSGTAAHVSSLGSKRAYLQLFMGQTFNNEYDSSGNNSGFKNAGPVIRLTFDTMWPRQRPRPETVHPARLDCSGIQDPEDKLACEERQQRAGGPLPDCTKGDANQQADCRKRRERAIRQGWERDPAHSLRYGLWHTDASFEFSRFPFGEDAGTPETLGVPLQEPGNGEDDDATPLGLRNAFSGSLGLTWQPNRFASYDHRDANDLHEMDPQRFDAYRWGLFGKAGVTTRPQSETHSANNSINRIQFGVRFTHSRSNVAGPVEEDRNEIPIRFVEISYGRFSEWAGLDSRNRVVIDAGLRITALSNQIFPVYAGMHLNTGPGPDDLRVFIGTLVKLDKLGALVQGATE